jgi:thiol:disulfide interchange protein DsbC
MKSQFFLAALLSAGGLVACAPDMNQPPPAADGTEAPKADAIPASNPANLERVRTALKKTLPEIKPEDVSEAGSGLYQVRQGSFYGYVTADGKYLVQGDLVELATGAQVTENLRKSDRVAKLKELGEDNMIVFAPQNPADTKFTITAFTDVDCGYCRKLHSEIAQYNQQGIAVRYVFYPRTGPDSSSFQKAQAVWCSADRKAALTSAKLGAAVGGDTSCPNPIQREWELGQEFGLRGTPMLVMPDGEIVNGYVPAPQLAQRLTAMETAAATPQTAPATHLR